jgi:hypothetical protein
MAHLCPRRLRRLPRREPAIRSPGISRVDARLLREFVWCGARNVRLEIRVTATANLRSPPASRPGGFRFGGTPHHSAAGITAILRGLPLERFGVRAGSLGSRVGWRRLSSHSTKSDSRTPRRRSVIWIIGGPSGPSIIRDQVLVLRFAKRAHSE